MQYGYGASAKKEGNGPKFLRITDIVPDLIDWSSVPFCEISNADYNKYKIKKGDIFVARTGATAGYAKLIRNNVDAVFAGYLIRITPNKNCSEQFLGRLLESNIFKDFVDKVKGGSAQPQANAPILKEFEFYLPELVIQKKIASILSTYDKLIENNTKRIEILEEMAQRIYKEWFVDFKYPGHENNNLLDSELGMIPKGWDVVQFKDIVDIYSSFAFKSKTFVKNGKYGLVTIKNVHNGKFIQECENRIEEIPAKMKEYCLLKEGDILLSLTGNVGRVCLAYGDNYLLNQRVAKLAPIKESNKAYTYSILRDSTFQKKLELISTGTAQQNLSPILMGKLKFPLASDKIMNEFSKISNLVIEQIISLYKNNNTLKQTRDHLLPKLISGKVDVSDLDIDTSILNE